MSAPVEINYWAEGPTDRAAARRIIEAAGGAPGADFATRRGAAAGKDRLDRKLGAYNAAARHAPWLILRDGDSECAVDLVARLLRRPAPLMRFRVVVPCLEAWLLADREAFARFMRIARGRVPTAPEGLADLKRRVIALAETSSSRDIRRDFCPTMKSGRKEGPGYAQRLQEFIVGSWDPDRAAATAPSLKRAMQRVRELTGGHG